MARIAARDVALPLRVEPSPETIEFLHHADYLPITPVSGRAEPADFGAAESGTCRAHFWRVLEGVCRARQAAPTPEAVGDAETIHTVRTRLTDAGQ
jgi:hypothetical protein